MKKPDWSQALRHMGQRLGALKYPLLVLLLGLVLLALPKREAAPQQDTPLPGEAQGETDDTLPALEARLEQILSEVAGAGRVRVMLRYAAGPQTVYQTDTTQEVRTEENGKQTKTTLETVVTSGGGQGTPVSVQTLCPTFQGALVVADGADSAAVKLDLVNAVSSLTGLGADKITVIKMK